MGELHTILLVEDDPRDVELTLTAFEGHNLANRVVVVRDGQEALDYMYRLNGYSGRPEGHPVVILLDIKMPKIDGLEVLQRLKSDPETKSVPIVVLTSSRESRDLEESYQRGANAFVVKPVKFDEFIGAVKEIGVFWALLNEPPP